MTEDVRTTEAPRDYATFTVTVADHVAEIVLDRPDLLNRADHALLEELTVAFAMLGRDRDVRAIVLAAIGRAFSAGGDFASMQASHDDYQVRMAGAARGKALIRGVLECASPIVVALHADVIGVATSVVLCCDAVVAARDARLIDPHVNIGLVAGDGGVVGWPAAAGLMRARRFLLTGEPVPAPDAYRFGLVTDLVDTADEALPAARALAARIARRAPLAVQGTRRSLSRVAQARVFETLDYSFEQEGYTLQSDDLLEALAAFREKRRPVYHGR